MEVVVELMLEAVVQVLVPLVPMVGHYHIKTTTIIVVVVVVVVVVTMVVALLLVWSLVRTLV